MFAQNNNKMIKVCKTTEDELPRKYLTVLNGIFGLTPGEIDLTAMIISEYRKYGLGGVREPYISKLVFSTDGRKDICERLNNLTSQNFGNKLNQLVSKNVLLYTNDTYSLNKALLPMPEVTFKFELIDGSVSKNLQEGSG